MIHQHTYLQNQVGHLFVPISCVVKIARMFFNDDFLLFIMQFESFSKRFISDIKPNNADAIFINYIIYLSN